MRQAKCETQFPCLQKKAFGFRWSDKYLLGLKCHEAIILKFRDSPFSWALSCLWGPPSSMRGQPFLPISHLTKGLHPDLSLTQFWMFSSPLYSLLMDSSSGPPRPATWFVQMMILICYLFHKISALTEGYMHSSLSYFL